MPKKKAATKPLIKNKPLASILLAKRIKDLRLKSGYSSYDYFAYEKNISRSQYGRYEKGEDLRFSSLVKVIKAFNLTPAQFFEEGFDDLFK